MKNAPKNSKKPLTEPEMNRSYNTKPALMIFAIAGAFFLGMAVAPKTTISPQDAVASTVDTEINRDSKMIIGDPDAKVKIIEYADPLCPFCTKFAVETEQKLRQEYIDTGKVEFEYRGVAMIVPDISQRAIESLHCAADQDKFWPYLDHAQQHINNDFYSQGKKGNEVTLFNPDQIGTLAEAVGMDTSQFIDCVESGKHKGQVVLDTNRAIEGGVKGTPMFYIGGERYAASTEYNIFEAVIKAKLK